MSLEGQVVPRRVRAASTVQQWGLRGAGEDLLPQGEWGSSWELYARLCVGEGHAPAKLGGATQTPVLTPNPECSLGFLTFYCLCA